jgi:hypothetical protein
MVQHEKFYIINQEGERLNFLLDKGTYSDIDTMEQRKDEIEGNYLLITVKTVPRYTIVVWTTAEVFLQNVADQTLREPVAMHANKE